MTKEEIKKLKETVAYFGHWYDVIGIERVLILERSIDYISHLEKELAISEHDREHNDEELVEVYKKVEQLVKENEQKADQLTKAIELLKDTLLMAQVEGLKGRYETVDEIEQFLKDSEVEI